MRNFRPFVKGWAADRRQFWHSEPHCFALSIEIKVYLLQKISFHAWSFPTHSLKNKTWGWKRLQKLFQGKSWVPNSKPIYYFIHITGAPETAPGSELGLASVEPSLRSGDVAAVEGRLPRKSWKKSTSSDLGEPRKVVLIGILIMVYEIIPI